MKYPQEMSNSELQAEVEQLRFEHQLLIADGQQDEYLDELVTFRAYILAIVYEARCERGLAHFGLQLASKN